MNQTLQIYLGSLYVNSFNAFGRHWQVNVQAEGDFRNRVDDINLLQVRNNQGQMVPLGTLANVREIGGPIFVNRYNLYTAASVSGSLQPGVSSGEVIASVDKLADKTLALSMNKEWTELMFMQIRAGNTAMYVFGLAVACVFLALAALYESWSLPLAVILVVPLCLLCSVLGVQYLNAKDNSVNIFVQIGLVVLVGLACKNSILIVEFAKRLRERGQSRFEATQGGLPAAAAADPDDVLRLHPGRGAAGVRHRGRGRDAPLAGNGRLQRHVGRNPVRHLPYARLLLRHLRTERDAVVHGRAPRSGSAPR